MIKRFRLKGQLLPIKWKAGIGGNAKELANFVSSLLTLTWRAPDRNNPSLTGEVPLGLEREEGESEAEEGGDADGHQDPVDVVVDGDARDPEWQGQSEDTHRDLVKQKQQDYFLAQYVHSWLCLKLL